MSLLRLAVVVLPAVAVWTVTGTPAHAACPAPVDEDGNPTEDPTAAELTIDDQQPLVAVSGVGVNIRVFLTCEGDPAGVESATTLGLRITGPGGVAFAGGIPTVVVPAGDSVATFTGVVFDVSGVPGGVICADVGAGEGITVDFEAFVVAGVTLDESNGARDIVVDPDCDGNSRSDCVDIGVLDCNTNLVPDACDINPADPDNDGFIYPDCNTNGRPDVCDITANANLDCDAGSGNDGDGVIDACQIPTENGGLCTGQYQTVDGDGKYPVNNPDPAPCDHDCNLDQHPDWCDINNPPGGVLSLDCNGNEVPDECEIHNSRNAWINQSPAYTCGTTFREPTGARTFRLLACDVDCNENGVPDGCDINDGTSEDRDINAFGSNGIPDECEIDENQRSPLASTRFYCDDFPIRRNVTTYSSLGSCTGDCNENGIPDNAEIFLDLADDVNGNGVPDDCEPDCNGNGIPDDCDIIDGSANGPCDIVAYAKEPDCNGNGIPDSCEANCNGNFYAENTDWLGVALPSGIGIPDSCDVAITDPDDDGVVWADCNGNGIPDECDVASQPLSFTNQIVSSFGLDNGDIGASHIAAIDLNANGSSDLVLSNLYTDTITVLQNNGKGIFDFVVAQAVDDGPAAVAVGDLDNDGLPDIVVANFDADRADNNFPRWPLAGNPENNKVTVLWNNGNGTFSRNDFEVRTNATGASPRAVAIGDVDGNGSLDLVIANRGRSVWPGGHPDRGAGGSVSILRNTGGDRAGRFTALRNLEPGQNNQFHWVTLTDLNNDGLVDLVAVNRLNNSVMVRLNDPIQPGTYAFEDNIAVGPEPVFVVAADLNGDGFRDLITANRGRTRANGVADNTGNYATVTVLRNSRSGTFPVRTDLVLGNNSTPPRPINIAVADLDQDGDLDLAVAAEDGVEEAGDGQTFVRNVWILPNNGTGGFPAAGFLTYTAGVGPSGIVATDIDGDGDLDLAVSNRRSSSLVILRNERGAGSRDCNGNDIPDECEADCNVNGIPDACDIADGTSPDCNTNDIPDECDLLPSLGFLGNTLPSNGQHLVGAAPADVKAGLLNPGATVDLAVVNRNSNNVSILLQDASGGIVRAGPFQVGAGPVALAIGNLDATAALDIAVVNRDSNSVTSLRNNGQGTFAASATVGVGTSPADIVLGDWDGDGDLDAAVPNEGSNTVSILRNNGNGTFTVVQTVAAGGGPVSIAAGDLTGDGRPDLVVANRLSNNVTVLINNGTGTFAAGAGSPYVVGASPVSILVADLTGDGLMDVATANQVGNSISVLTNGGTGAFPFRADFFGLASPTGIQAGDLDGDGDLDLGVVNTSNNTYALLRNDGTGTFALSQAPAGRPYTTGLTPSSLLFTDMNADGRLDLVFTNRFQDSVWVRLNRSVAFSKDCNINAIPDACDLAADPGLDDNDNGIIDSCEVDCNENGIDDSQDIEDDTSEDCNENDIPDECEISVISTAPGGPFFCTAGCLPDCNNNGIPDSCDIASGFSLDTTPFNGIPDECEEDCNANGTNDSIDIANGTSFDCNTNGVPDECDVDPDNPFYCAGFAEGDPECSDCNFNGVPDSCDIATGSSSDCNDNLVPDECDPDCDVNGVPDDCDITNDPSRDCNANAILDDCELSPALAFQVVKTMIVGSQPRAVAIGDLNGDELLDLVTADSGTGNVSILRQLANGDFVRTVATTGNTPAAVVIGDVDGDDIPDVLVANEGTDTVSILKNTGTGVFSFLANLTVSDQPVALALFNITDIDDSEPDTLAVAHRGTNTVGFYRSEGNGTFQALATITVGGAPSSLLVVDINDNDFPDLVVTNSGTNSISVLRNQGGTFSPTVSSYLVGVMPVAAAAADVDDDGDQDLIIANQGSNNLSVLLNDGSGVFVPFGANIPATRSPSAIVAADLDGNGTPDLAVTSLVEGDVTFFLNSGTGTFAKAGSGPVAVGLEPVALMVTEIIGDEQTDIVVVNRGSNNVRLLDNRSAAPGPAADCNQNGVPDECDIADGTSLDVDPADGVPDECKADCNDNGIEDSLDIESGFSEDCNENGVPDDCDIEIGTSTDCDENGIPDECQGNDSDGDGVINPCDECPGTPSCAVVDAVGCPLDSDDDGVFDGCDLCPGTPAGEEVDEDGCSTRDTDDDGVADVYDECPGTAAGEPVDADGCSLLDDDNDGVNNDVDDCPETPVCATTDERGCPTDSDGDGVPDGCDLCPDTPAGREVDENGCITDDADGDGVPDDRDECPATPACATVDARGCPIDTDGDGTPNGCDLCPSDPSKIEPGLCGCGTPETDTDGDGTPNCLDLCPNDPDKIGAGLCGCGTPDTDTDGDGTPDCLDQCPADPDKNQPGICGCGEPDVDADGDGALDCNDGCPADPNKVQPGICGCGVADTDIDLDGVPDCNDNCPSWANPDQSDSNGNGIGDACDSAVQPPPPLFPFCGSGVVQAAMMSFLLLVLVRFAGRGRSRSRRV